MSATEIISDRAANIDRYEGVEDTVVDLYGSVRNAYFQRRAADLKE
jgi:ABC-type transporter lipoprotein component MlaA